jgi:hypothetical protein
MSSSISGLGLLGGGAGTGSPFTMPVNLAIAASTPSRL